VTCDVCSYETSKQVFKCTHLVVQLSDDAAVGVSCEMTMGWVGGRRREEEVGDCLEEEEEEKEEERRRRRKRRSKE
jgi:hypothetical protein